MACANALLPSLSRPYGRLLHQSIILAGVHEGSPLPVDEHDIVDVQEQVDVLAHLCICSVRSQRLSKERTVLLHC